MNIIAIDIGNTNIGVGLFLDDEEKLIESIPGKSRAKLARSVKSAWEQIPVSQSSREGKRDGVIVVSSVKPVWTKLVEDIAKSELDEKPYLIGKDIPLPISTWVDEPDKVGVDRVVSAAAAYAVVEDAIVVVDFGTAVTIDLVEGPQRQYRATAPCQSHQTCRALRQEHSRRYQLRDILLRHRRTPGDHQTLCRRNRQMAPNRHHRRSRKGHSR